MIIIDELPFKFVEGIAFRRYMQKCQPAHIIPSRSTIIKDCYQLFLDEKAKLKSQIKHASVRICLTTDTWTSLQRINYMCVTAHFIDNDWKLQKKVLNFCPVSSHMGHDIGKALEMSLIDWGLQNVLTVTVDNASSNDVAIDYIKKKIVNWESSCVLQGKWTHITCVAHILNLVVQNGLEELGESVERVRSAVKYVRQSPDRLKKFMSCAEVEKCDSKKSLCLDVSTRWNSTYLMLSVAQTYERAFDRLSVQDSTFSDDLDSHGSKLGIPTSLDWKNIKRLVSFLQHFYELTLKISGTKYITANAFLDDISCIHGIFEDCLSSDDDELARMAAQMKKKFDKYWGSYEKFNLLVFIASMLDPRNKFEYVEIVLKNMYGDENGSSLAEKVKNTFYELFDDYKRIYSSSACASSSSLIAINSPSLESKGKSTVGVDPLNKWKEKFRVELKKRKLNDGVRDSKSELDKYFAEDDDNDETNNENFSVLGWWKINSPRFPILSLVARDVLAIPISTVASESVFSTGGRVLDSFRSSLTPKIAQALICCQDWIRSSTTPVNVEENIEELENFERDLKQSVPESTCVDI